MIDVRFFPSRLIASPTVYAFASTHPDHKGLLKVGYTERAAARADCRQFPSGLKAYQMELIEPCDARRWVQVLLTTMYIVSCVPRESRTHHTNGSGVPCPSPRRNRCCA